MIEDESKWLGLTDPLAPRQDAPAGDAPAGDAPRPEEAWVSDPLAPGQDAPAGDAPRSEAAFLRAHLAAERAKKQRYKSAVRKQNTQIETLVENADDVIGLPGERKDGGEGDQVEEGCQEDRHVHGR
jgi:hypothetical protein